MMSQSARFFAAVLFGGLVTTSGMAAEYRQVIDYEAYPGVPFGIARVHVKYLSESVNPGDSTSGDSPDAGRPSQRVEFRFSSDDRPGQYIDRPVRILDDNERVFYPAVTRGDATSGFASQYTVHFLFRGPQPLEIELVDRRRSSLKLELNDADEDRYEKSKKSWWSAYKRQFADQNGQQHRGHEIYLQSMLARRLDLPMPRPRAGWESELAAQGIGQEWTRLIALVTGMKSIEATMAVDSFRDDSTEPQVADQHLPTAAAIPPVEYPEVADDVVIEPLARVIPEECYYVRCRSFADYVELRSVVQSAGALFAGATTPVPLGHGVREKLELQLALTENAAARVLAEGLVEDMALIGTDFFFREGPSFGVVFHLKEGTVERAAFRALVNGQRQAAAARPSVSRAILANRGNRFDVDALTSPDNSVRSFMVDRGEFVLLTNSHYIAERFSTRAKVDSNLAELGEFRYARSQFNLSNDYPQFIYLSDPFFRKFIGSHYRVEMSRRLRSKVDLESVGYAQLCARAEGQPDDSIDALIEGGFLTRKVLNRPDGTRPVLTESGPIDSLRGGTGRLLPIPDVEIEMVTAREASLYRKFASKYAAIWRRMDPVIVAINKKKQGERETLVFDVAITPYARREYPILSFISMLLPDKGVQPQRVQLATGDLLNAQISVSDVFLTNSRQMLTAFAGVRDVELPVTLKNGELDADQATELLNHEMPFYVGLTGSAEAVNQLFQFVGGGQFKDADPDENGYVESKGGFFRRWDDGRWIAGSENLDLLKEVTPNLQVEDTERLSIIRVKVADLAKAKVRQGVETAAYWWIRNTSASAAKYLDEVGQQFKLEPAKARSSIESVLGGRVTDPLGGELRLSSDPAESGTWVSSHWPQRSMTLESEVPPQFSLPLLDSIHGLEFELTAEPARQTLKVHFEILQDAGAN